MYVQILLLTKAQSFSVSGTLFLSSPFYNACAGTLADFRSVFPFKFVHLGGDEVDTSKSYVFSRGVEVPFDIPRLVYNYHSF